MIICCRYKLSSEPLSTEVPKDLLEVDGEAALEAVLQNF